jgi:hypothetical protein
MQRTVLIELFESTIRDIRTSITYTTVDLISKRIILAGARLKIIKHVHATKQRIRDHREGLEWTRLAIATVQGAEEINARKVGLIELCLRQKERDCDNELTALDQKLVDERTSCDQQSRNWTVTTQRELEEHHARVNGLRRLAASAGVDLEASLLALEERLKGSFDRLEEM